VNILLHPAGSHGDVHPFIGIGQALVARGHAVTLVTLDTFRPLAERNGMAFVSVGTDEDYRLAMNNPDLWKPRKGLKAIFQGEHTSRLLRQAYDQLVRLYVPGETVVVAGTLGFAARTAHETHGLPLATVHLQPSTLFSVERPAVYPQMRIAWWPRWAKRAFFRIGDVLGDRWIGPAVNSFRAGLGLPPAKRILGRWLHSPQRVIGLFPKWYGSAPDWLPHVRQTGIVRYDQGEKPLDPAVDHYLRSGDPPIVFSFGTAMMFGRQYFETAVEACRRLGKRGLILARGGDQIPPNLPPTVAHFEYVPFGQVFPRAAAVVHHGGIGTTAQALASGVPQVVAPIAFDQPDNADRVVRLGCGRAIPSRKVTPRRMTRVLTEVFTDPSIPMNCRQLMERMTAEDPLPETCRLIEELVGKDTTALSRVSSVR
jgi:rhamnosyltransferase subunit B